MADSPIFLEVAIVQSGTLADGLSCRVLNRDNRLSATEFRLALRRAGFKVGDVAEIRKLADAVHRPIPAPPPLWSPPQIPACTCEQGRRVLRPGAHLYPCPDCRGYRAQ